MKCICVRDCYVRIEEGDKPQHFRADDILEEVEKCPPHFVPIDSYELDLETASLEVLMESDTWEKDELIKIAKEKYNVKINKNTGREKVAQKFVDARDRHVTGMFHGLQSPVS